MAVLSRILAKENQNGKIFLAEPILLTQQELPWRRASSRDPLWRILQAEEQSLCFSPCLVAQAASLQGEVMAKSSLKCDIHSSN